MHKGNVNSWISLGTSFVSGTFVSMIPTHFLSICELQCAMSAVPLVIAHRLTAYLVPKSIHQILTRVLVVGSILYKTHLGLSLLQLVFSILSINSLLSIIVYFISYQKKREIEKVQVSTSERGDLKDIIDFVDFIVSGITTLSYVAACFIGVIVM